MEEDIKGLRDATEEVKRYADLLVAHNAREKPAPVAFSVISSATDEIVRIAKRYIRQLSGASMLSFAPVDQFSDVPRFSICNNEMMTSAALCFSPLFDS